GAITVLQQSIVNFVHWSAVNLKSASQNHAGAKLAGICQAVTNHRSVRVGFILKCIMRGSRACNECSGSSGVEAHLGVVLGFGRELGAVVLRKETVAAQQLGQG